MNKTTLSLCAGLVLGGLVFPLQAQNTQPPKPATPSSPPAISPAAPSSAPIARPMMADPTERYASFLNLTEEQKPKFRAILDEQNKQMMEIREKTQEKMKAILTPEQWQKYYRPAPREFNTRMQGVVRSNAPTLAPAPVPPAPTAPKAK